jgi:hypothetical protein
LRGTSCLPSDLARTRKRLYRFRNDLGICWERFPSDYLPLNVSSTARSIISGLGLKYFRNCTKRHALHREPRASCVVTRVVGQFDSDAGLRIATSVIGLRVLHRRTGWRGEAPRIVFGPRWVQGKDAKEARSEIERNHCRSKESPPFKGIGPFLPVTEAEGPGFGRKCAAFPFPVREGHYLL